LQHQGSPVLGDADILEYADGGVRVLFPEEERRSLNPPVEETPQIPWENDPSQSACVNDLGAKGDGMSDDTGGV